MSVSGFFPPPPSHFLKWIFALGFLQCDSACITSVCSNISNPTMRTGLDFKSEGEAEDWVKGLGQGEAEGLGQNART